MTRILPCVIALLATAGLAAQQPAKSAFTITYHARVVPPGASTQGVVAASDKVLVDALDDLNEALDGKWFRPNNGNSGSPAIYKRVSDPEQADIILTIVARGTSSQEFGARTMMQVYRGVVLADTVPMVGVTRFVSMVLAVGTYKKEFVAWSTNSSRFSASAWGADAKRLALMASDWVIANEAQVVARQKTRPGYVEPPKPPTIICVKKDGTVIPCLDGTGNK